MTTSPKHMTIHDSHETRIALLEQAIGHITQTLIRLENKMDDGFSKVDNRFSKLEAKMDDKFAKLESKMDDSFDKMENRMDKLDNRLWQIMFIIFSSIAGLIISKLFHLI